MAAILLEVTCIVKRDHRNPHERIRAIGVKTASGSVSLMPESEAIAAINAGTRSFYVSVQGKSVTVVVAEHEGREYLKTTADGYEPNNLLSLDDCS